MTVTETNFMWFLVGDVILIYVAVYAFDFIANRIWFWFVDRVLEAQQERRKARSSSSEHRQRLAAKSHKTLKAPGLPNRIQLPGALLRL